MIRPSLDVRPIAMIALLLISALILAGLLATAAAWMLVAELPAEKILPSDEPVESLLALHTPRLPQLRPALDSADSLYIRHKLSRNEERAWRNERRKIIHDFLLGLGTDFSRLKRMARVVGVYSARRSRKSRLDDAWLAANFRLRYRVAMCHLPLGGEIHMRQLARLAGLAGCLSSRVESGMALPPITSKRSNTQAGASD